jgi:hypothetical protein
VEPPEDGYFAVTMKLRWPDGSLLYLPNANPGNESPWQHCNIPYRTVNEPGDPSVAFGCVPLPLPSQALVKTGVVAQFQMECNTPGASAPAGAVPSGLDEPNLVLVPRPGDAQNGSHFLDENLAPVDPELRGATIDCYADADGDGCLSEREAGPDPLFGGGRDPNYFWDFFDTPGAGNIRDGAVTSADVARVAQRFGTNDLGGGAFNRQSNPLSLPGAPITPSSARQNYHPAFDRSPSATGISGPADGIIPVGDVALIVAQFGHSCVAGDD